MRRGPAEGITRPGSVRAVPDDRSVASGGRSSSRHPAGDRAGPGAVPGTTLASVSLYLVVLERAESGAWIATVPAVPGCHTHGRSLVEAKRRVREALALWVDDADSAELVDDVRLPKGALAAVQRSVGARERVAEAREAASVATTQAVERLVDKLDLGVRDAAYLLGVSFQRVQQIAQGQRPH